MRNHYIIAFSAAAILASSAYPAEAVKLLSGGVGEKSEAAIEQIESQFNLKVTYTGERGMYLSDVDVSIEDSKGNVVANGKTNGPILLAELDPGRYVLTSSINGLEKKQTVNVTKSRKEIGVNFLIKDNISVPAPTKAELDAKARTKSNINTNNTLQHGTTLNTDVNTNHNADVDVNMDTGLNAPTSIDEPNETGINSNIGVSTDLNL